MSSITETTHRRILASAERVFARHGYRKTSMDDIAQDALVAKGSVYLAAPSKRALFLVSLDRRLTVLADALAGSRAKSLEDRLFEQLERMCRLVSGDPLVLGVARADRHARLPEQAHERLTKGLRMPLLAVLQDAVRQGQLRRDLDLEEVAAILVELVLGAIVSDLAAPSREHRWETLATALLEGLGT